MEGLMEEIIMGVRLSKQRRIGDGAHDDKCRILIIKDFLISEIR